MNNNSRVYTASALIVGYLLSDNNNYIEQNILGNWLMLVAQTLVTNAYYTQLTLSNNSKYNNSNINDTNNYNNSNDYDNEDTLKMLINLVNTLNIEIDNIKKDLYK